MSASPAFAEAALADVVDPALTIRWKTATGAFVTLDAAQIIAIAQAVSAHVQAYFDREAELQAEIEGPESLAALEAVGIGEGWP